MDWKGESIFDRSYVIIIEDLTFRPHPQTRHKILSREFVKWDEKIFRMIKMNIRTRNELAFIASIFPVMRSKPMPKSVWDEILLALVDDKVCRLFC